jgi:hypothetical protein
VFVVPRAVDLDRFLTVDEGLWMYHSSQFYYALGQREFENTYQRFHPGVTMMWAGTLSFLVEFPEFRGLGQGYLDSGLKLGDFLEENGKNPLDLLVVGRAFMLAQNAFLFILAYWLVRQMFPIGVAASVFSMIALEPFYVSLTNIFQMDGLMASYMFASILALLVYLYRGSESGAGLKKHGLFILSAVMAGAAVVTKAPAIFLLPFTGLMLGIQLLQHRDFSLNAVFRQLVLPLLAWCVIAVVVMVVLWPALWADPVGMFDNILSKSTERVDQGAGFMLFFDGQTLNGRDYPWYYYLVSFVWRSSPVTLFGLLAAAVSWLKRWGIFQQVKNRRLVGGLVISAVFFTLEMGLGAMKMDRYIIPVHLILTGVGVLGWVALSQKLVAVALKKDHLVKYQHRAVGVIMLILFALQSVQLASKFPYYYAYYNPLLGGTRAAEKMFWLGWGEGLDQVADYLNQKPDAEQLTVMALHAYGPLSYFFEGTAVRKPWDTALPFSSLQDLDYMVIYVSERQTNIHPAMLEVLGHYQPEFVVKINGVDYARLYSMHEISPADWENLRARLPAN